jgi:hypothetical protein
MSKEISVIAIGVWITLVPFLGVPGSWKTVIFVLSGILLVVLGFFLRAEVISRGARGSRDASLPFVENIAEHEDDEMETYFPRPHERKEKITSLN